MTEQSKQGVALRVLGGAALLLAGLASGVLIEKQRPQQAASHAADAHPVVAPASPPPARKVLYWYDPMKPDQHFDKPGRSPFMDMDLVPRYAEAAAPAAHEDTPAGIAIDAALTNRLGLRTVQARRGRLATGIDAIGEFQYNARDIATVQSRADGFVERVYGRAPGEAVARGAPLVDLLLPSWGSAQQEFLSVLDVGDPRLLEAARTRLRLTGMSQALITRIETTRRPEATVTLTSPIAGVITSLDVRMGMRVSAGTTLVVINGSDPVWLEVAVPETRAAGLRAGAEVRAELATYTGEAFTGVVASLLPAADSATRSVRVRASFANHDGRLRPGLAARVHIAEPSGEEVVLVPATAVIHGGDQDRVIEVLAGGRYAPRIVQVGREAGDDVEILHGLAAGDTVAESAQFLLDADANLKGLAPSAPDMHQGHAP